MIRAFCFLLMIVASAPALAVDVDPAAAFGALEGIRDIDLSPDGSQIAFIAPTSGPGNSLYVAPVDKHVAPKPVASASGAPESLVSCDWVTNARLVCLISAIKKGAGQVLGGSRYIALDSDGKNVKPLYGSLVDLLVDAGNGDVLVGYGYHGGSAVERLNSLTLKSKRVGGGLLLGGYFISDGLGKVRIGRVATDSGFFQGRTYKYFYHAPDQWQWQALSTYDSVEKTGFLPLAVDPKTNLAYGLLKTDGRDALVTMSLDDKKTTQVVLARKDVDVDNVVTLGRRGRIVGATFVTDRRRSIYFDPDLTRIHGNLAKLFPSPAAIDFVGASDDEARLLVRISSDTEPGTYYVFDKQTRHLEKLILARPELATLSLASVTFVEAVAGDGTKIPAYLTLPATGPKKGLPAIIMPHGGPEARDEFGFDWLAQYFAHQGFAVLQPNFRGSSGYGDAWFVNNGFQSWATAVGDVSDSGRWLIAQGVADPQRIAILGWSYGGYAALQSGVRDPGLFKAIVAIAPVTDFDVYKSEYSGYWNQNLARNYVGSGAVADAGSPARHASTFVAPVLMFHGDLDQNVSIRQSRLMESRLKGAGKSGRLVVYPGLDHQLADAAVRADMLRQARDFLSSAIGRK